MSTENTVISLQIVTRMHTWHAARWNATSCRWSPPCALSVLEVHAFTPTFFFFQAEDGIRDLTVTGVQTCALPISLLDSIPGTVFTLGDNVLGTSTTAPDF